MAKAAAITIPIVFSINEDPVRLGLVGSLARPGGNLTGINFLAGELQAKRLELLRELVPGVVRVAVLVNRTNPTTCRKDGEGCGSGGPAPSGCKSRSSTPAAAARSMRPSQLWGASGPTRFSLAATAFSPAGGCKLLSWAAQRSIPATYASREHVEAGGLISYGSNIADAWRQVGVYVGRVLKGAKPADLPVVQATKFELVINH